VKYINEYFAHLNKKRNTGGLAITFFTADVALFLCTRQEGDGKAEKNRGKLGKTREKRAYVNVFAKWRGDSFIELILAFALLKSSRHQND